MDAPARRLSRVGAHVAPADAAGVLKWLSALFGGEEAAAEPEEPPTPPPVASLEPGRFWIQGVAGYFNGEGLKAFQEATLRPTDVVFVSYPKCGTSWLHQILFCLLRMDDEGGFDAPLDDEGRPEMLGSTGQVYPDSVPVKPASDPGSQATPGGRGGRGGGGGRGGRGGGRGGRGGRGGGGIGASSIEALMAQPEPRLFTTHIRGPMLPPSLQANGRLVVIARNPKDAIGKSTAQQ